MRIVSFFGNLLCFIQYTKKYIIRVYGCIYRWVFKHWHGGVNFINIFSCLLCFTTIFFFFVFFYIFHGFLSPATITVGLLVGIKGRVLWLLWFKRAAAFDCKCFYVIYLPLRYCATNHERNSELWLALVNVDNWNVALLSSSLQLLRAHSNKLLTIMATLN